MVADELRKLDFVLAEIREAVAAGSPFWAELRCGVRDIPTDGPWSRVEDSGHRTLRIDYLARPPVAPK